MFKSTIQKNRSRLGADHGSASVEFVVLAVPLFLPIFIYLTQFAELSNSEINARSLVRQVVRAYVASESIDSANYRANLVLKYGGQRLGFRSAEIASMRLTFTCSANPCLTPGARVRGTLTLDAARSHRSVQVAAQEYVSPWQ